MTFKHVATCSMFIQAVSRAMDAVQEFVNTIHPEVNITKYMLSGTSKVFMLMRMLINLYNTTLCAIIIANY